MMTFPTIPAGQLASAAIGDYDDFIAYLNAVSTAVDANTSGLSGKAASSHTHAIDALLPTQTGNSGKVLQTDGSAASWATVAGGGSSNPEDESTVIASRLFG